MSEKKTTKKTTRKVDDNRRGPRKDEIFKYWREKDNSDNHRGPRKDEIFKYWREDKGGDDLQGQISEILLFATLAVYLLVSFFTGAWDVTWLIWVAFIIIRCIVLIVFLVKGQKK